MAVFKKEKNRLPYGYYTKKDFNNATITSFVLTVSSFLIFGVFQFLFKLFYLSLCILFVLLIVTFFIVGTRFNQFNRCFKQYIRDLDFNKLEERLQFFMKQNLHSESRNELLMQYANLLLNYDVDRACMMWKNVKEPEINKWIYDMYKITMLSNSGQLDEANSFFKIFKIKYKGKFYNYYQNLIELHILVNCSNEEIVDFEKRNSFTKNNRFDMIMAYARAMKYYYTRGKIDLAKKYALLIKEENAGFTEIDKIVVEVLKEEY